MELIMHSRCNGKPHLILMLLPLMIALIVLTSWPVLGQNQKSADGMNGQKAASSVETRYLLFWTSPERVFELAKTVGTQGDGRTRLLGIGVTNSTFAQEKQVADNIHRAFTVARQHDLALMLHFDFHVEWRNRPDLWN